MHCACRQAARGRKKARPAPQQEVEFTGEDVRLVCSARMRPHPEKAGLPPHVLSHPCTAAARSQLLSFSLQPASVLPGEVPSWLCAPADITGAAVLR